MFSDARFAERSLEDAARRYCGNRSNRGHYHRDAALQNADGLQRYFADVLAARRAEVAEWNAAWAPYVTGLPARILDAGCGPGFVALALADRYPDAEVVGVDIEPEAIALGRAFGGESGRVNLRTGDLLAPPAADLGSFDLIVSRTTLEHVRDPQLALSRLLGSLNPGGALFLETPNYLFPYEPHVRLWMLPKSPKRLLALECRLFGHDAGFIDHLQFACDPLTFKRWAGEHGDVEIVDLMAEKLRGMLRGERVAAVAWRQTVVDAMRRRRPVAALLARAAPLVPFWPSVQLLLIDRRPA